MAQHVEPMDMEKMDELLAAEMRRATRRLSERRPEQIGHVTHHRDIASDEPILAGTRIPTATIWTFYEEGFDEAAILHEYPQLTPDDVRAAIAYESGRRQQPTG